MQFHKKLKGGFLGPDFLSKKGLPVINIPGCPAHPDWMTQILVAIATLIDIILIVNGSYKDKEGNPLVKK